MENIFDDFNEIEWRTYETFSAIESFEKFWAETERLVSDAADIEESKNGPNWTNTEGVKVAELFEERRMARYLHDEIVTPTFRYSAVITLFAVFEKEFRRFGENISPEKTASLSYKDLKGPILDQVCAYTKAFCGFSPATFGTFSKIRDLQKIRDCIVHCYGDPSLSRDKNYLLSLSCPTNGVLLYEDSPMEINVCFLEKSVEAIKTFFINLFISAGWKINQKWLINR